MCLLELHDEVIWRLLIDSIVYLTQPFTLWISGCFMLLRGSEHTIVAFFGDMEECRTMQKRQDNS